MDMNQLLESIYASSADESSLEKTAERAFLGAIDTTPEPAEENPFASLSLDELVKLANDLETAEESVAEETAAGATAEEVVTEEAGENEEELNKTAAAMFGGQLMAHAVVHELGLIKVAVANGMCRVCKTVAMDVPGSSVCSSCGG